MSGARGWINHRIIGSIIVSRVLLWNSTKQHTYYCVSLTRGRESRSCERGATAWGKKRPIEMGAETTSSGGRVGGGGFRAKLDHYMYSGNPKHVFAGITIIAAVFAVPWYLMSRGTLSLSLHPGRSAPSTCSDFNGIREELTISFVSCFGHSFLSNLLT